MKKRAFLGLMMAFSMFAISCDDDIDGDGGGDDETGTGVKKYVIAASSDLTDYLFVTDNLESGSFDLADGFETDKKATIWQWHTSNKYIYGLVYNQGNNGIVASYRLTSEGEMEKRSVEYNADRFTTHGSYDKYVVTAAGVTTDISDRWYSAGSSAKDSTVYAQGATFVLFDAETQVRTPITVSTENLLGDGEYVVFSGIVEKDGKLYTAACPAGTSGYGAAQNDSEVTATTANPNRAAIAIYNNLTFTNPKIIEDDRISYATGRYRSQYYSGLSLDDEGNLYVFSSSYDSSSEKPSGVVRIKAGTDEFDGFYFNIFEVFGRRLFKVWYITDDYFLVQLYSTEPLNSDNARKLAIFKAGSAADGSAATLKEVTGLPAHDNIASFGKVPYSEDGMIYMPVSSTEGYAIYKINPQTATATKGLIFTDAEGGIGAVGLMEN